MLLFLLFKNSGVIKICIAHLICPVGEDWLEFGGRSITKYTSASDFGCESQSLTFDDFDFVLRGL